MTDDSEIPHGTSVVILLAHNLKQVNKIIILDLTIFLKRINQSLIIIITVLKYESTYKFY